MANTGGFSNGWFLPEYNISPMHLYYCFAVGYLQWNENLRESRQLVESFDYLQHAGLDILHYAGLGSFLASRLSHSSGSNWTCPS